MKDFSLDSNSVVLSDERELLLQQIDLLFDTSENEVLGEDFGSNFYKFLWDLTASPSDITEYTKSIISANINLLGWDLDVETNILEGTKNDIILVTIKITKYDTQIEKTYKVD